MTAWDLYWITLAVVAVAVGAVVYVVRRIWYWCLTGRWARRRKARRAALAEVVYRGGVRVAAMVRHLYEPR